MIDIQSLLAMLMGGGGVEAGTGRVAGGALGQIGGALSPLADKLAGAQEAGALSPLAQMMGGQSGEQDIAMQQHAQRLQQIQMYQQNQRARAQQSAMQFRQGLGIGQPGVVQW